MSQQSPVPQGDWASQTADKIEQVIGQVRSITTQPLVKVARIGVFGLLAGILGIAALVLVAITVVRLLTFLPGGVWVAHLITGLVFVTAGFVAMVKRHGPLDTLEP